MLQQPAELGVVGEVAQHAASPSQVSRPGRRRRETWVAYGFLSPVLVFFLFFMIVPFLFSIVLALSDWNGFNLSDLRFVGLRNFSRIFGSHSDFITPVLVRTILFATAVVFLALVGSLVIANAINRLKFQGFLRTLYFLPIATTVVAVGNVWKDIYEPSGGLLNGVMNAMGFKSMRFLSDPNTALPSIVIAQAWASLGIAMLIFTAALKAIPQLYYEAAELDGANSWTVFWHITLPLLRPALLFVSVTQIVLGLQSFALILVMTGDGGPAGSTTVAALEMYQRAFTFGKWGPASAMALVLFALILAITLIQLRIARGSDDKQVA